MRDNEQTLKIELLSHWKLEAEFRNSIPYHSKKLVRPSFNQRWFHLYGGYGEIHMEKYVKNLGII